MNYKPIPRVRDEKGQALVELSLVAVLLFTLVMGITDFARLYFTYASMNNAAREGTRYGIVNPYDTEGIEERTESMLVIFGTDPKIEVSFPDGSRDVGARIRVRVTCEFRLIFLPILPFEMSADSTMRIEYVP